MIKLPIFFVSSLLLILVLFTFRQVHSTTSTPSSATKELATSDVINEDERDSSISSSSFTSHESFSYCQVCQEMTRKVEKALDMTDTDNHIISYGHRLDEKGQYKNSKKVEWSKSELRLIEALEGVCDESKDLNKCHEILEDHEDSLISNWYKNAENEPSLTKALCSKIYS